MRLSGKEFWNLDPESLGACCPEVKQSAAVLSKDLQLGRLYDHKGVVIVVSVHRGHLARLQCEVPHTLSRVLVDQVWSNKSINLWRYITYIVEIQKTKEMRHLAGSCQSRMAGRCRTGGEAGRIVRSLLLLSEGILLTAEESDLSTWQEVEQPFSMQREQGAWQPLSHSIFSTSLKQKEMVK